MKLNEFLEKLNENYNIRWKNNKVVWELPEKDYTYNGYTEKEYNFWRDEISGAGYGYRWEKDRKKVYGKFQKAHKNKPPIKYDGDLIRRKKEKEKLDRDEE